MRRLSTIQEEPIIKTKLVGVKITFKNNDIIEGKSFFKRNKRILILNNYTIFNYLKEYNKKLDSIEIENV